MLEYLKQLDAELLCTLNGWNCPYADQLMWLVSGSFPQHSSSSRCWHSWRATALGVAFSRS